MIRIMITNIEWDTDGESVELPTEHELCCEGAIADDLSDVYGWCTKSFCVQIIDDTPTTPGSTTRSVTFKEEA